MHRVKLRVITTGHGQGNTQNAAEFSQLWHSVMLVPISGTIYSGEPIVLQIPAARKEEPGNITGLDGVPGRV